MEQELDSLMNRVPFTSLPWIIGLIVACGLISLGGLVFLVTKAPLQFRDFILNGVIIAGFSFFPLELTPKTKALSREVRGVVVSLSGGFMEIQRRGLGRMAKIYRRSRLWTDEKYNPTKSLVHGHTHWIGRRYIGVDDALRHVIRWVSSLLGECDVNCRRSSVFELETSPSGLGATAERSTNLRWWRLLSPSFLGLERRPRQGGVGESQNRRPTNCHAHNRDAGWKCQISTSLARVRCSDSARSV